MWKSGNYKKVKINGREIPLTEKYEMPSPSEGANEISLFKNKDMITSIKNKKLSEVKIIINRLNKLSNQYSAHLIKALIYNLKGNPSEAKKELLSIVTIYPEEVSFSGSETSTAMDKLISEKALEILDYFYEIDDFKEVINLVATFLERNLNTDLSQKLTYRYDVNLSSLEFDKKISSPNFALKYPQVWFDSILERKNFASAENFLKFSISLFPNELKNAPYIFTHYFPANDEMRQKIFTLLAQPLVTKKDEISLYRKLVLMENGVMRKWFEKEENKKFPPYFKMQRDFYRSSLSSGKAIDLSFYHLFELGDESVSYFKWLR